MPMRQDLEGKCTFGPMLFWDLLCYYKPFFVIGLRLLGQQMVDPYGDDLEDLSVLYYVWSTADATKNIMNTQYPEPLDPKLEEDMARGQTPMDISCGTTSSADGSPSEEDILSGYIGPDTRPLV
mmetsp:Transcript_17443/g.30406  ORF Transcript_17443/g.30406 Transcript_17443/m.30406 type:complete len:124 (-) Transcript_17443:115-486(-)